MKEKQEKSHGIHFVMIRRIGSWNCAEEEGAARSFYFFSGQFFPIQFRRSADGGFPSLRVMTFVK